MLTSKMEVIEMPLTIAPLNTLLRVIKVLSDEKTKKHLSSLGITVDSTLKILSESSGNPILEIKDGRIAIDRDIALKIIVAAI